MKRTRINTQEIFQKEEKTSEDSSKKRCLLDVNIQKEEKAEKIEGSFSDDDTSSEKSTPSDAIEVDAKKSKIFVSATVTDDNEIELQLSPASTRPDTHLKGQGDHITSYVAIITAIFFSANENTIVDAIVKIKNFIEELSADGPKMPGMLMKEPLYEKDYRKTTVEKLKKTQAIFENIDSIISDPISTDLNKKINEFNMLRCSNEDIKIISGALKRDKLRSLAASLATLVTYALESVQSAEMTTVFSRGRVDKKKNEGSLAKEAARALVALNRLCQMTRLSDEKLKENLDKFKKSLLINEGNKNGSDKHVVRYGLSHFTSKIDSFAAMLGEAGDELVKVRAVLEKEKNAILDNPAMIAEKIGDLYDYKQQLRFDLAKALPNFPEYAPNYYIPHKKALTRLLGIDVQTKSDIRFESKVIEKNKKKTKTIYAVIHRQAMPFLIQTILKHFAVIETAFPFLKDDTAKYDAIKKGFLENEVLQKSGWGNIFTLADLNACLNKETAHNNNYDDMISMDFSCITDDENEHSENDKNAGNLPRDNKKGNDCAKKPALVKSDEKLSTNSPFFSHATHGMRILPADIINNNEVSVSEQFQKLTETPINFTGEIADAATIKHGTGMR